MGNTLQLNRGLTAPGAGNLWAMNNWKPSAYIDVNYNPGGDGVVTGVAGPV
jgi:hypothetical protein